MLIPAYTRADVIRWLNPHEVRKGERYLASVAHLQVQGSTISAQVQGSARLPYQVSIQFERGPQGELRLGEAVCSCPVGWDCKHAAAVLLAALAQGAQTPSGGVRPQVLAWLEQTRVALAQAAEQNSPPKPSAEALLYVLRPRYAHNRLTDHWGIAIYKGRPEPRLDLARAKSWNNVERALIQPPRFVREQDLPPLRLLWLQAEKAYYTTEFQLAGAQGDEILRQLAACGRLYDEEGALLRLGEPRVLTLEWGGEASRLRPLARFAPNAEPLLASSFWYLDRESGEIGLAQTSLPAALLARLLTMPPLESAELPVVASVMRELAPQLPMPAGAEDIRTLDAPLTPVLDIGTLAPRGHFYYRYYDTQTAQFDYAVPRMQYGEFSFKAGEKQEFVTGADGQPLRIPRNYPEEAARIKQLAYYGFLPAPWRLLPGVQGAYGLASEADWPRFVLQHAPEMVARGWEIRLPADFRHRALEVQDWQAEVSENAGGWFDLDLGIVVDGKRVALAPLLFSLFRRDERWLNALQLQAISDDELLLLNGPEGKLIQVAAARIKPLARTLMDLFDMRSAGPLKLSKLDAPRLAALADHSHWKLHGAQHTLEMAARIRASQGLAPCAPPQGLAIELRPYQREGLSWLQYLREHELAGILADDMGLGKTAQTLAHLLLEKESGRLDKPALVVLPTSLIFNWKREAERFAPGLRVLSLHGKERAAAFARIAECDVALTTYPLLWRDEEALTAQTYHLLILDEAQMVKNAASQAAQVVRKLSARHRLCLTGTPLENHLGELWAQFDFLLPGFLGDHKTFARAWRAPVEKQGDSLRRDLLARRVKPFILRRRKEEVAKELPPKTIIVRSVEMEGGQRDLYETVRSAMDRRVRDEIAAKGFARSHIVILDALLKLRQVCCDPRLLKLDAAKKVKERAKLALLMDMLPELVEEGRRVLVFSQFTSMLALIEIELVKQHLRYVQLTGETTDREGVIRRFQDGEAPIFLISLKTGGVGLNLTTADTVIHFDPWWNPAVENQATDRAHRIGQSKNVFVYKLVVAGSIEEKILALQEKKAELAAGVLSEDAAGLTKFGAEDIAALLAPLPEVNPVTG